MWLLAGAVPEALRTKQAPSRREDKELAETRAKAEAGDPPAANRLGVWYEKGRRGLPVDVKQAVYWYSVAAKANNGLALHNLGDCYRDGIGVKKDEHIAFDCYLKAAATGLPLGYEDVGDSILRPDIAEGFNLTDPDERRATAMLWYRKAAKHGRESAVSKLKQMGQSVSAGTTSAPPPVCHVGKLPGTRQLTGAFLRYTYPRSADAYGFLIRNANGEEIDVIIGNGDCQEFAGLDEGDAVTLKFTSERSLDIHTSECSVMNFYVPDSGKILKKARGK